MWPALVALTLALSAAPRDAALAARISRLFDEATLTDDATERRAKNEIRKLFDEHGLPSIAEVGDDASYTFAMLVCDTTDLAVRDRVLTKVRAAGEKHEIPQDAVTFCDVRTKQDRVKATARRRPPTNPALRDEIQKLFTRDQAPRLGGRLDASLEKTDRELHEPLEQIFAREGVPTYAAVGPEAASQFATMIQHQPPDFRRKVLPKLKANVDVGQGDAGVYAMMYDRAATDDGRPQRYGENFSCDLQHSELQPNPIEDEAHVDERRAALGKVRLALQTRIIRKFYKSPCPTGPKQP